MHRYTTWMLGAALLIPGIAQADRFDSYRAPQHDRYAVTLHAKRFGVPFEDALGAALLGRLLDLDVRFVVNTQRRARCDVYAAAPGLLLGGRSSRNCDELFRRNRRGETWGSIYASYGYRSADFGRQGDWLRCVDDAEFTGYFWDRVLVREFRCSSRQIARWRRSGYGWDDIAAGLYSSTCCKRPTQQVFERYEKHDSWDRVYAIFHGESVDRDGRSTQLLSKRPG